MYTVKGLLKDTVKDDELDHLSPTVKDDPVHRL